MKSLFMPGIALMNRLRYPFKFALVGAVSMVVIGSLFAFFVSSLREDINFTHTERAGLELVPQMIKLIKLSQQHRGLAAGALNGNQEMRDKLPAKTAELDEAAQALDKALAASELSQGMAQRWSGVKDEWARLRANGESLSSRDNLVAHTKLVAQEIIALHDIGDVGLLALDPSADTYYLIDNVLRRVPNVAERLGRLRATGTAALATRSMDEAQRYEISRLLGELELSVLDLNENFDRSIKANPALRDELAALGRDFNEASGKVVGELQEHVLKGDYNMAPQAYYELVTRAIDVVYEKSFNTLIPATSKLLTERENGLEHSFALMLTVSLLCLAAMGYLGVAAYLAVVGTVAGFSSGAAALARGELGTRIDCSARDEMADAAAQFNTMAQAFSDVIRQVQHSSDEVTQAAMALAASATQVSRGSEQQSEAASSMATAVEEMTVGVDEIARNAKSAEEMSARSGELSAEGGAVVVRSVSEMERIASVVTQSAGVIQELGDQSAQISEIVNSIKEIADQTNLLALNAAIEAARAGESGRGFAVVADEVRKLAERTGKATEQITGMVGSIQAGTNRAVSTMQDGVARVREGVGLTNQAGTSMAHIREGAISVVSAVTDISAALKEQSAASAEIARNVERIARMAEENCVAVGETASTARQLERLAQHLRSEVQRFHT